MPRVNSYSDKYMIRDEHEKLKQECRTFGITLDKQAEVCGCTKQNLSKLYKNNTLSFAQFLLINKRLEEEKRKREEERLKDG